MTTLLIVGMMVGYFCSALVGLLVAFSDDSSIADFTRWTMGSFGLMTWPKIYVLVLVLSLIHIYAYARLHEDFMKGKITLIGCPKLDAEDYSEKLTQIIANNDIQSVTIARMEVPCCGGLEFAAKKALQNSGKFIPWQVITVSVDCLLYTSNSRNAHNAVLTSQLLFFIDIYLSNQNRALQFTGQFVDDRAEHTAGTTPSSPKVNKSQSLFIQNFILKAFFVKMNSCH